MKKSEISLLCAFALTVALAAFQIPFSKSCETLREDTLRLHVVANSDSEADQEIKLTVRDAVLESLAEATAEASSASEAANKADLRELGAVAEATLKAHAFDYSARACITKMFFEERSYENTTLPAGVYTALRVELGEAKGKNWWCVVYPSLCYPAASDESGEEALEAYSEEEREIVSGRERLKFKFKLEELLQSLKAKAETEKEGAED